MSPLEGWPPDALVGNALRITAALLWPGDGVAIALMIGLGSYAVWQVWRARRPEKASKWVRVFHGSMRQGR